MKNTKFNQQLMKPVLNKNSKYYLKDPLILFLFLRIYFGISHNKLLKSLTSSI